MVKAASMLRCMEESGTALVPIEVQKGVCESHIEERTLTNKLLKANYYTPKMCYRKKVQPHCLTSLTGK